MEVATKMALLEEEVAKLKGDVSRQAERMLTADQRKTLIDCLQQSPPNFCLQYRVRPDDSEAIQYVMQFIATLYNTGKSLGAYMSCTEIPLDLHGVVIQVWDTQNIPHGATILAQALSACGITYRIDTLPTVYPLTLESDGFALVIGHK
jgi:hypothetical protein